MEYWHTKCIDLSLKETRLIVDLIIKNMTQNILSEKDKLDSYDLFQKLNLLEKYLMEKEEKK